MVIISLAAANSARCQSFRISLSLGAALIHTRTVLYKTNIHKRQYITMRKVQLSFSCIHHDNENYWSFPPGWRCGLKCLLQRADRDDIAASICLSACFQLLACHVSVFGRSIYCNMKVSGKKKSVEWLRCYIKCSHYGALTAGSDISILKWCSCFIYSFMIT